MSTFNLIDHVGIAVESIDAALPLYTETLKMPLQHREVVEEQGVEAVLLGVGDCHIELLAPLGPSTPVGKFLAKRGQGMHHVAYRVDNIERVGNASHRREPTHRDSQLARRVSAPIIDGRGTNRNRSTCGGSLMPAAKPKTVRVNVGFTAGQSFAARVDSKDLAALQKALGTDGWQTIKTDEGDVTLDVSKIACVLTEADESRVGFGS